MLPVKAGGRAPRAARDEILATGEAMRSFRADRSRRDGRKRFNAVRTEVLAELRAGATVVGIWETHSAALRMSYEQFSRYVRRLRAEPVAGVPSGLSNVRPAVMPDRVPGAARPVYSADGPRPRAQSESPMAVLSDLPGRETKDLI